MSQSTHKCSMPKHVSIGGQVQSKTLPLCVSQVLISLLGSSLGNERDEPHVGGAALEREVLRCACCWLKIPRVWQRRWPRYSRKTGYGADVAHIGADGLAMALTGAYDVLLLDIMLPDMSGMDVLRELREAGSVVPVILLTARQGVGDRVAGLDAGADDSVPSRFMQASCSPALERSRAARQPTGRTMRSRRADLCLMWKSCLCRPVGAQLPLS